MGGYLFWLRFMTGDIWIFSACNLSDTKFYSRHHVRNLMNKESTCDTYHVYLIDD